MKFFLSFSFFQQTEPSVLRDAVFCIKPQPYEPDRQFIDVGINAFMC